MDDLAKNFAADTRRKVEILAADLTNSKELTGVERILCDDSGITLLAKQRRCGHRCAFTEFGCRRHEREDHAPWRIDRGSQMSCAPYSTDGRGSGQSNW